MANHAKILFRLSQDEDGYPPVAVEGVWATKRESEGYTLDNIPFFTRDATLGDTVAATDENGTLWFERTLSISTSSLLRVVLFDPARVDELRTALESLGCSTEWDKTHKLVAVDVPGSVSLVAVQTYLEKEAADGWLDYEEALLRQ